jgi:hypothetical protein
MSIIRNFYLIGTYHLKTGSIKILHKYSKNAIEEWYLHSVFEKLAILKTFGSFIN